MAIILAENATSEFWTRGGVSSPPIDIGKAVQELDMLAMGDPERVCRGRKRPDRFMERGVDGAIARLIGAATISWSQRNALWAAFAASRRWSHHWWQAGEDPSRGRYVCSVERSPRDGRPNRSLCWLTGNERGCGHHTYGFILSDWKARSLVALFDASPQTPPSPASRQSSRDAIKDRASIHDRPKTIEGQRRGRPLGGRPSSANAHGLCRLA